MQNIQFKTGKMLGRKHFAKIASKGDRWKRRNVPNYIRKFLLVPYYTTEGDDCEELHIIQYPLGAGEKVHFTTYARSKLNEETT